MKDNEQLLAAALAALRDGPDIAAADVRVRLRLGARETQRSYWPVALFAAGTLVCILVVARLWHLDPADAFESVDAREEELEALATYDELTFSDPEGEAVFDRLSEDYIAATHH